MKKGTLTGLSLLLGASTGAAAVGFKQKKKDAATRDRLRKMGEFYELLLKWLEIEQKGHSIRSFFVENGYKTIAIYGMKELGERLFDELKDSEVEVKYIIDKQADTMYADVDIVTPEETLEEVDAIVVTAIHYMDEIEDMLEQKVEYPIISLEEVIDEVLENNL
ncbi:MAG: hypothetical protein K2J99_05060 [Lachnospiraceae bacterium]|nr:hypothetical protein [Lachnospiraceae bacterium]